MLITIINDCQDENARGRQVARALSLFHAPVHFVGAQNDLEASGMLVDMLDASVGEEHVILVNVAPRAKKSWWLTHDFPHHENGTYFCHFKVGAAHVFSSVDGYTLSLVKKLALVSAVDVITYEDDAFRTSQFRSFTYLPSVAARMVKGETLPTYTAQILETPDAPHGAWTIDNFGNVKTTLTNKEATGDTVDLFDKTFTRYPQLADIPEGELAATVGSSGYGDTRFIELIVQGGNAAKALGLR